MLSADESAKRHFERCGECRQDALVRWLTRFKPPDRAGEGAGACRQVVDAETPRDAEPEMRAESASTGGYLRWPFHRFGLRCGGCCALIASP